MTGKISRQIKICLAALVLAVFFFTPSVCRAGNEIYVAGTGRCCLDAGPYGR